jgi:hypothetical protein
VSIRLRHPVTGAEFDAGEQAVPQWRKSGWVPVSELAGGGRAEGDGQKPAAATPPGSKAAGKAEVAAKPTEE